MTEPAATIGHNVEGASVTFELRLFNSLSRTTPAGCGGQRLTLPAGSRVSDLIRHLSMPPDDVFLVLVNGRDITPGLVGDEIRTDYVLQDRDRVALSGPVPYSWGYGAPIV